MDDDFNTDSEEESGGNEWLATYGDLVTLLLCFFVLLFAMSSVDARKFAAAAGSVNSSFAGGSAVGMEQGGESVINLVETPIEDTSEDTIKEKAADEIYSEVKKIIDSENLDSEIAVKKSESGVLLTFRDDLLFDKGEAVLKSGVKQTLYSLGNILKKYNNKVRIEGHTDNTPIKNNYFESNWELSTSRAISVVKYYTEELPENERISANIFEVAGLGEYSPVAPNDTAENRQKNRRIEIIILK
jgi:chemotaxis protein MotB